MDVRVGAKPVIYKLTPRICSLWLHACVSASIFWIMYIVASWHLKMIFITRRETRPRRRSSPSAITSRAYIIHAQCIDTDVCIYACTRVSGILCDRRVQYARAGITSCWSQVFEQEQETDYGKPYVPPGPIIHAIYYVSTVIATFVNNISHKMPSARCHDAPRGNRSRESK